MFLPLTDTDRSTGILDSHYSGLIRIRTAEIVSRMFTSDGHQANVCDTYMLATLQIVNTALYSQFGWCVWSRTNFLCPLLAWGGSGSWASGMLMKAKNVFFWTAMSIAILSTTNQALCLYMLMNSSIHFSCEVVGLHLVGYCPVIVSIHICLVRQWHPSHCPLSVWCIF